MNKQAALSQMLKPADRARVEQTFLKVIADSFQTDVLRSAHPTATVKTTHDEIKRRTNLCYDLFMMMRKDVGYSTHRALDMLPFGLRSELDGTPWVPPPVDRSWSPSQGSA
jgi:hypothetical protein